MKIRLLTPEDKDFSGAPAGGAGIVFFDAVTGSDSLNDGSAANKALRSADFLPPTRAAGQKVIFRRGPRQIVRRRTAQTVDNSSVWALAASGASGNPAELESWGTGQPPLIAADLLSSTVLTQPYAAVTSSFGNTFLSANGVQGRMPAWCSLWHQHYIGRDALTYSFWCPNSPGANPSFEGTGSPNPGTPGQMSRWEFAPNYAGSEGIFVHSSSYTQVAASSPDLLLTTSSSTAGGGTVLNFADTSAVRVGMSISGAGIASSPTTTTVVSKTSTTVTMSQATVGGVASGVAVTFGRWWEATNYDAAKKVRYKLLDASGAVDIVVQGMDGETVVQIEHPALAVRYGVTGPIKAWLRLLCNAQSNRYLRIVGWDYATSILTATTGLYTLPSGGPHVPQAAGSSSAWAIVGHPLDLAQGGQFSTLPQTMTGATERALYASAEASVQDVWIVPGNWMRGEWTVANRPQAVELSGSYLDIADVEFGRTSGTNTASTPIGIMNPGNISNSVWARIGFVQCLQKSEDSVVFGDTTLTNMTITDIYAKETPQCGFWRNSIAESVIDGMTAEELGRTFIVQRNDGGALRAVFRNHECHNLATTHGNVETTYTVSKRTTFEYGWHTNSARGCTSQVEGVITYPRDITRQRTIYSAPRLISTAPGPGYDALDNVSYDSAFGGCLHDQLFVVTAENSGIRIGPTSGAPSTGRQNDNGLILRCYTHGFTQGAGAAAVDGGANLEIRDSLITKGTAPSAPCTVTRTTTDAAELSRGGLSLGGWERMTRTNPFDPLTPTYAAIQLGPDRLNWQIPAYVPADPAGNCGTPVDLVISVDWYRYGHQAGKAVGQLARMRPGTNGNTPNTNGNFWIDNSFGDGGNFLLDTGYIVPLIRLTAASYSFRVYEQALNGSIRATVITLTARR